MKNVLITGGTGFIGSHMSVALHEAGYHPVLIDTFENSDPSVLEGIAAITGSKPTFYETDFRDHEKLKQIIETEGIEAVIHFAAYKAVGESVKNPYMYYENNVAGFVGLTKLLSELTLPLVFSSSATIYGDPDTLPITENSPVKPAGSPYGATKQMCERIIEDASKADQPVSTVVLRYFNPVGAHPSGLIGELPRGVPNNLVPFIAQAAAGIRDQLTVHGNDYDTPDGSCIRDYIHVVDLAGAHVAALKKLETAAAGSFDVYNIGTGTGSSVLETITTFEQVTGQKVPYAIGPRRPGDVPAVYASVDKASRELGWKSKLTLADALRDTWNWQQKLGEKTS